MVKKNNSDAIDETAFQALEDALNNDFDEDLKPRSGSASQAREKSVSEKPQQPKASQPNPGEREASPREKQAVARQAEVRKAAAEQARPTTAEAKSPTFAPANDASRRPTAALLRTLDGGAMRGTQNGV